MKSKRAGPVFGPAFFWPVAGDAWLAVLVPLATSDRLQQATDPENIARLPFQDRPAAGRQPIEPKHHVLRTRLNPNSRILTSVHRCIKLSFMRTTVTLDRDIYEAALHLSRVSGRRLGKVLSDLARRGLTRDSPPARRRKSRFPAFQVPAGAPIIAASRVQEFLDEEGPF